jgi:hypothetical protein
MIKDFIETKGISWSHWELMTSMEATTLRGSYLPHPPQDTPLYQIPEAGDEAPSADILSLVPTLIEHNTAVIRQTKGESSATAYFQAASVYLKTLSLSKQKLLEYTLNNSDIYNTGICGETANKLNLISLGAKLEDTSLEGLIKALERTDLPRIYAVVHIAPSHRFHVEKVVDKIFLLQSWVGRFSLASWVSKGNVEWELAEFLKALQIALPVKRNTDINQYYSLLFNLKGAGLTPSAHTSDQVSCAIYQSADNRSVRDSMESAYHSDVSKWS